MTVSGEPRTQRSDRPGLASEPRLYAAGMTDVETTVLVAQDGAVATVTLSRPKALNALTHGMLGELAAAIDRLSHDKSVRVIVLTGEGRSFSAGVDLKGLSAEGVGGGSVSDVLNRNARAVIGLLTTIPQIVIAKVNGFCFTGALELALACDLVVVADEAKLGDTHAKWGLRPTWGMSARLIRVVGVARARELSYTARTFSGTEAAEWGLAVRSVPLADLDGAVDELVATLTENSAGSLAAYKDLYRHALDLGLAEAVAFEERTAYPIADAAERVAGFG
jgi:enoyl-CoA hydratase/carnithine racemase